MRCRVRCTCDTPSPNQAVYTRLVVSREHSFARPNRVSGRQEAQAESEHGDLHGVVLEGVQERTGGSWTGEHVQPAGRSSAGSRYLPILSQWAANGLMGALMASKRLQIPHVGAARALSPAPVVSHSQREGVQHIAALAALRIVQAADQKLSTNDRPTAG